MPRCADCDLTTEECSDRGSNPAECGAYCERDWRGGERASEIVTYPEMDSAIVDLLRIRSDNPVCRYAAARIVALEAEVRTLRERAERAEKEARLHPTERSDGD